MNTSSDCQAFILHLKDEHQRLNEVVEEIEVALGQGAQPGSAMTNADHSVARLRQLRERLERHFQEEEEGGCIEEAVARCPGLSSEAFDLEHDHLDLISELDRLIADAEKYPTLANLKNRYHAFVGRLRKHEAHENELLQQGFNVFSEG